MIRYSLHCKQGHLFEGWFGSSSDFDAQQERGLLECPVCGSAEIAKSLMSPAVSTSREHAEAPNLPVAAEPRPAGVQLANLSPEQRRILREMRELKTQLLAKAENVGEKFSEEARKIHYGEAKQRGIYGRASAKEAAELIEEGIEFMPLPDLPEDSN